MTETTTGAGAPIVAGLAGALAMATHPGRDTAKGWNR